MGETFGHGPPAVLALHGWARSRRDFFGVLAPKDAPTLDAIALDLPGFGSSPPPPEPWGSPEYAALVAPVLDQMRSPVVLLGHSFGGRVAVHLAAQRPDAIAGMVLTGVPLRRPEGAPRRAPIPFRLGRRLHRLGLVSEHRMEALRQRYGSSDYRAAQGIMRQVLVKIVNESYEEVMVAARCPVRLVWGEDDEVAPASVARAAAGVFPNATMVELPGVGHLAPLAAPAALREAVVAMLGGRPAP